MAQLLNLYYSFTLIHEDPTSDDFPLKKRIVKLLIKNMVARLTHLFGQIWVIQRGGVPSGCFDTSHMDSWIMLLYFCLFCMYQIMTAPPEHQELLEKQFIEYVRMIVYGDNHNWNQGPVGSLAHTYFACGEFTKFLKEKFLVILRDNRNAIPFCSTHISGWLIKKGTEFLKHFAVLNRNMTKGQATFLPYRETREYIARAIWGRIPKSRDLVDTLLSVLGHVYGTHGSNYDAWKSLKFLYEELLHRLGTDEQGAIGMALDRVDRTDIKKMRQHGITLEDLRTGFPRFDELQKRNIVDPEYQKITQVIGEDEDYSEIDFIL